MDGVIRYCLMVALVATALAGCVTSTTRPGTPASPDEAARYNMQLGISYLRQGDYKAAQEKLERALATDDRLGLAHMGLGVVLEKLGDPAGAERSYRRAVALEGENPDALNALAVFLCLQKQERAEALRLFDRALAVPPARAESNKAMINTNAGTCAKRGSLDRAETYLRAALAIDPQFPAALLQMADVAFTRGVFLQARAFLERFLVAAPATPDALWLGFRIEQAQGSAAAAADYADRLKRDFPESIETRQLIEGERRGG
ncbi:MAG: type IV pilus biogenesis/stability protein PilW [Gammaproteobacteria bacterium]|nr:type IV pilus biogenesis/stability protein PilW [Gammaproteobacteria bacterium]